MQRRRTGVSYGGPAAHRVYLRQARLQSGTPMPIRALAVIVMVTMALGTSAIYTNAFGVGDRYEHLLDRIDLLIDPPPNRPTRQTVLVTAPPDETDPSGGQASPSASAGPDESAGPTGSVLPSPSASPTPTPAPTRGPIDTDLLRRPERYFASELTKDDCAPAGTQMVLAMLGLGDTSAQFQQRLIDRTREWESWEDSHNGGWGPAAIAEALAAYGASDYQIRAYETREAALFDAALAIRTTLKPVVLLTWRGAHTWVMTGFRADADPVYFADATVTGAYIHDPWYPRISSIWGPSDPPGTFQDAAEMERNYLPWQRPEGAYPDRDGRFIAVVPTIPRQVP